MSPDHRKAERRQRLLDAALELFGTQGYPSTSARAVCTQAGVNARYFYESFDGREDLLYHLYLDIVTAIGVRIAEAVELATTIEDKARAGLREGWEALTDDRRKARIIAIEVVGVSPRLEELRREVRHSLADLTARQALSVAGPGIRLRLDPVLTSRSLMGGVVEILADWINGDCDLSTDAVVEHFTILFAAAAHAAVEPEPGSQ